MLSILKLHLSVDVFQVQNVGFSEILSGSTSGNLIGLRVAAETTDPRQFHDNLSARQRNLAGIDRKTRE